MLGLVKQPVESAMSSRAVAWVTRRRVRGKCLILAYHGVIPEGQPRAGESTLFIEQRDFAAHLDVLSSEADVVPLDRIDEGGNGRPRVAITIDDAYRGAVTVGVRELATRSLPATIFVAPGRLNDHVFWWDALAHRDRKLDDTLRDHALQGLAGADERVRDWAASGRITSSDELPDYARTASRDELAAAIRFPGITLGSHTWSHPNLAALDTDDVITEIRRSRDWLQAEFGDKTINWLAYPYGLETAATQRAVADASYAGALRVVGGWHRAVDVSPFARPRFNVGAGYSVGRLRALLNGVTFP